MSKQFYETCENEIIDLATNYVGRFLRNFEDFLINVAKEFTPTSNINLIFPRHGDVVYEDLLILGECECTVKEFKDYKRFFYVIEKYKDEIESHLKKRFLDFTWKLEFEEEHIRVSLSYTVVYDVELFNNAVKDLML